MDRDTVVNIGIQQFDSIRKGGIFEFKVLDEYDDEEKLEDTIANAHRQIEEKQHEAELVAEGFSLVY